MKLCRSIIVSLVLTIPVAALAGGVESEMNNMFGTMTNTTDPQIAMGARRGTITGGAYSMRGRVMTVTPLSIEPPQFQAGCGGIDAYMGSFSWASKQQVVAMMRSIASNAVGYAFSLALNAACADCDTQIKDFMSRIQEETSKYSNSCAMAQAIVDKSGAGAGATNAGNWLGTFIQTRSGSKEDTSQAQRGGEDGQSPADEAVKNDPEEFKDLVEANVVWQALKKQPVNIWWVGGGSNLGEELMSLTGSAVSCHLANSPGCGGGSTPVSETNGMVTYILEPTIHLDDLVWGGKDGVVQRYSCDDGDTCYGPGLVGFQFKGFNGLVEEMLLGTDGNGGILAELANPNGSLSQEQNAFLSNVGPLGAAIVRIAKVDVGAARQVARTLGPKIALDLAYALAKNAMRTVKASTSQMYGAVAAANVEQLARRSDEFAADYKTIDANLQVNLWALDYVSAVIAFLPAVPPPDFIPTRGY